MKRVAGFRTRDGDNIVFVEVTEPAPKVSVNWTEVIRVDQLVVNGHVAFEPDGDEHRMPGEWGRVGPLRTSSVSRDVVTLRHDVPLTAEDAKARDVTRPIPWIVDN